MSESTRAAGGGQFFDNGADTDHPASVAGTFGATTGEAGGTGAGSLVGAFGAERQTDTQ